MLDWHKRDHISVFNIKSDGDRQGGLGYHYFSANPRKIFPLPVLLTIGSRVSADRTVSSQKSHLLAELQKFVAAVHIESIPLPLLEKYDLRVREAER